MRLEPHLEQLLEGIDRPGTKLGVTESPRLVDDLEGVIPEAMEGDQVLKPAEF